MRILVVEDDDALRGFLSKGLAESGHTVDASADGKFFNDTATTETFDVIVLDRMLPGLDGIKLLRTLRGAGDETPVLLLSALGEVDERVEGLKAGGDDYLTKPFAFSELLARIEALARRRRPEATQTLLAVSDLEMDVLARSVRRAGHVIDLQPREYALLECLMRNAGQVVTRTMLLETVWGYHFDPQTNVIDVHISRLRAKIDRDFDRPLLHTVRGAGYVLRDG
jgi:two-component system OmpR family response regulator